MALQTSSNTVTGWGTYAQKLKFSSLKPAKSQHSSGSKLENNCLILSNIYDCSEFYFYGTTRRRKVDLKVTKLLVVLSVLVEVRDIPLTPRIFCGQESAWGCCVHFLPLTLWLLFARPDLLLQSKLKAKMTAIIFKCHCALYISTFQWQHFTVEHKGAPRCVSRERDAEPRPAPPLCLAPSAREEMLLNSLPKVKQMLGRLKSRLRLTGLGKHVQVCLLAKGQEPSLGLYHQTVECRASDA